MARKAVEQRIEEAAAEIQAAREARPDTAQAQVHATLAVALATVAALEERLFPA